MTSEKAGDVSTIITTIATNEEFLSLERMTTNGSKVPSYDAKPKYINSCQTRGSMFKRNKNSGKENECYQTKNHFKV